MAGGPATVAGILRSLAARERVGRAELDEWSSAGDGPPNWLWRAQPVPAGQAVVFDIDGVLSDAAGRQHFIERGRRDWAAFFEACGDDPVIEEVARLLELLDRRLAVVLVTGRPLRVRPQTVAWLDRYGLRWDLLVMRDRGDYDRVTVYKRGVVHQLRQYGFDLRLALEDDPSNHAMFVAEGVPCVYIHSGYYEE
jgi:hypothetical protein